MVHTRVHTAHLTCLAGWQLYMDIINHSDLYIQN